jgi:hypothetical protein
MFPLSAAGSSANLALFQGENYSAERLHKQICEGLL